MAALASAGDQPRKLIVAVLYDELFRKHLEDLSGKMGAVRKHCGTDNIFRDFPETLRKKSARDIQSTQTPPSHNHPHPHATQRTTPEDMPWP